ncbi:uncharacterized protein LOC143296454 [Babylonia areolata]|uniref:uncharacterized protein LOC143296454 n=1 Tax=Babylonia areolata TaxID=304850 RepID=UPI003FD20209
MPAYSYGDVMNDVYIEYADDRRWRLYSTEERPVNTSRFKIENGGWRVTELELSPGGSPGEGTAVITLTDIEQGAEGKVLASGTLTCNSSSGGITVNAQRVGGGELERMEEAMTAFKKGEALTFTADLSACSKNSDERPLRPGPRAPLGDDASEVWTGRVTGYRVPGKVQGAVEFTSVLMGPKQREVFNVRLQPPDQVLVKSYALSRPTHEPTAVVTYQCVLGTSGTFHIFRV